MQLPTATHVNTTYGCVFLSRLSFKYRKEKLEPTKMSIDPSKISIISSKKTSVQQFGLTLTDRLEDDKMPVQKEEICQVCCMAQGSVIAFLTCFAVASVGMAVYIFAEKRVNYTMNGVMRQIGWLTIPGTLVGTTLHFFLAESMWSGKRSSWGYSWTKALAINTVAWCSAVALGTVSWRYGLKLTTAGRRLYYKYPIPTDPLETRMMRNGKNFIQSMGWSYWLSGVASGQFGFISTVCFCVWNDRPHYLMAPHGGYALRCMPKWRRDYIEKNAIK